MFAGLVHLFGNMYIADGGICPGGKDCHVTALPTQHFNTPIDALYFSTVTMTTVGYGDYTAESNGARWLVIWELISGVLLVLLFLPLVMSRIASY